MWKATISERPDPDPQGPRECLSSDLSSVAEFVALLLERDGREFIEACISEGETHRSYVRLVSALACEVVAIGGRKSMDLAESAGNGVSVTLGVDTHKDAHVAVALDSLGRRLGALLQQALYQGKCVPQHKERSCYQGRSHSSRRSPVDEVGHQEHHATHSDR